MGWEGEGGVGVSLFPLFDSRDVRGKFRLYYQHTGVGSIRVGDAVPSPLVRVGCSRGEGRQTLDWCPSTLRVRDNGIVSFPQPPVGGFFRTSDPRGSVRGVPVVSRVTEWIVDPADTPVPTRREGLRPLPS